MNEQKYRELFTQFLNDYWGHPTKCSRPHSVNPQMLADSLFEELVADHERFAAV